MADRKSAQGGPKRPAQAKSVDGKPKLRSYGFLSHSGAASEDGTQPKKKSRGMLSHKPSSENGSAKPLDSDIPVKPWKGLK